MKKSVWIAAGIIAFGLAMASCSSSKRILCFNPTGYCGGSSTPDPDRIGGPSWFLWQSSAEERLAYYREECATTSLPMSSNDVTTCALEWIKSQAHSNCVQYYLPPIAPKDEAEEAQRNRQFESCKRDILEQHGLS
ncbi:MAG: hypothetical protein ABNH26_14410 [Celeribacter sp.]|jgi:hypothetical protein